MNFERPVFLFALLLAGLPAMLFFSRYIRSKRTAFPPVDFLFGLDRRPLARLRGRQIVATILRMALLVLAVLAFAGPVLPPQQQQLPDSAQKRTLLVIDTSGSMATIIGDNSLLQQARQLALDKIGSGEDDSFQRWAVVACPRPSLQPNWLPARQARETVTRIGQSWKTCHLLSLTEQLAKTLPPSSSLEIISDFAVPDTDRKRLADLAEQAGNITFNQVTVATDSLALERLQANREDVVAIVSNRSQDALPGHLIVTCGDNQERVEFTGQAQSTTPVFVPRDPSWPAGVCSFSLEENAPGPGDRLYFTHAHRSRHQVLVIDAAPARTPGRTPTDFIVAALRSASAYLNIVRVNQTEFSYDHLAMADVLVFVDPMPLPEYLEQAVTDFLVQGGEAWLFGAANLMRWPAENTLLPDLAARLCAAVEGQPFTVAWLTADAELLGTIAGVDDDALRSWTNLRHLAVTFGSRSHQVLARFSDLAPALIRIPVVSGSLLLWTMLPEADNGSTAFHPLFPLLIATLVDQALPPQTAITVPQNCTVGHSCTLQKASAADVFEEEAGQTAIQVQAGTKTVICREPGPYYRLDKSARTLAFVCSMPDEEQRPTPPWQLPDGPLSGEIAASGIPDEPLHLAPFLLLAALGVLLLELGLVSGRHRRRFEG
jgi:hypothetical protein